MVVARRLAGICRRRRLALLIGADAPLAVRVGAAGVHLPQRLAGRAAALRRAHPAWLITVAMHRSGPRRLPAGGDALILAPVLPSRSPSAVQPLGRRAGAAMALRAGAPVYALGGINARTAKGLGGFAGIAAIGGLADA
jgi:thiamine-phosphate pyrophosphorylase